MRHKKDRIQSSAKMYVTPEQRNKLKALHRDAVSALASKEEIVACPSIDFMPSQEWIDMFAEIGFYFYHINFGLPEAVKRVDIVYEGVEGMPVFSAPADYIKAAAEEAGMPMEWTPKNGEEIEATNGGNSWFPVKFIGMNEDLYVVVGSGKESYGSYEKRLIRQKPRKHQVTLDDLISNYAQTVGVSEDLIELIKIVE